MSTDDVRRRIATALIRAFDRDFRLLPSEAQRMTDAVLEDVASQLVDDPRDLLIDQGITRLQLLAFLRGDESDTWNGSGEVQSQWVRYRAHQIDRHENPDGWFVQFAFTDHDGTTNALEFQVRLTADAIRAMQTIDLVIDAVIAEFGPDGVA